MNLRGKKNENHQPTLKVSSDFIRIDSKFKRYWKTLFILASIYVSIYLAWSFILIWLSKKELRKGDTKLRKWFLTFVATFVQGTLFSLDGFVTSLLKTPFSQICYSVNKFDYIDEKEKDRIIALITESNEHCKETFKKFGLLTMNIEMVGYIYAIINKKPLNLKDEFQWFLLLSYLIPLSIASYDIIVIKRKIKTIKKKLVLRFSFKKKLRQIIPTQKKKTIRKITKKVN